MEHDLIPKGWMRNGLVAFAVLASIDIITTLYIINSGYQELNPIMASCMEYFIPLKILAVAMVYLLARYAEGLCRGSGAIVSGVPAIMTLYPVAHNLVFISTM